MAKKDVTAEEIEGLLRTDRLPSVWCPACGIGVVLNSFLRALIPSGIEMKKVCVVGGIGCSARASGYTKLDSFHTTHGRSLAFAQGLKLANPALNVVLITGDGDLVAIGGNHFIHAAKRNIDMLVICINNFTYGMTGGQAGPTTTLESAATTMPYGNFDRPLNLPFLAEACGAVYVARWTTFHVRQMQMTIAEAMMKKGFRFIEVISQCPELFLRRNKYGAGVDEMKFFKEHSLKKDGADTREANIDRRDGKIIVGKFVDRPRPEFSEIMDAQFKKMLGDKYVKYEGPLQTKV